MKTASLGADEVFTLRYNTNYHSHTAKAKGTNNVLSLSLPESVMDTFKVVLTFESEDEIVWFDHTNEAALALLNFNICYIRNF